MLTIYGTLGWVWQKTGIGTSQFSSHTLRHFRDLKSANIPGVAGRWGCMHWEPLANFESNRFNRFNRLHDFLWITLKHCIAKQKPEAMRNLSRSAESTELWKTHLNLPIFGPSPWWFHHPCRWARGFARPPFGWSWSAPGRYLRQNPTFHAKYPADHDCTGHST